VCSLAAHRRGRRLGADGWFRGADVQADLQQQQDPGFLHSLSDFLDTVASGMAALGLFAQVCLRGLGHTSVHTSEDCTHGSGFPTREAFSLGHASVGCKPSCMLLLLLPSSAVLCYAMLCWLQGLAGGLALLCLFMTYIQYATAGREAFLAFYSPQAEVCVLVFAGGAQHHGIRIPLQLASTLACVDAVLCCNMSAGTHAHNFTCNSVPDPHVCTHTQMVNRTFFTLISISLVAAAARHAYDQLGNFFPRHLRYASSSAQFALHRRTAPADASWHR
jgi:hypothetical protein